MGIIGYLFCILDDTFALYIAGLAGFTLLYALFYVQQLKAKKSAILLYLVALIVYSFGPLVIRYPLWQASLLFVLSILTGHYAIGDVQIVSAIMIAAGSNNMLKAFYALWIGGVKGGLHASIWLSVLGLTTIGFAFIV